MSQEIDYSAVLADLEAKRAILDNAIASLRAAIMGQSPETVLAGEGGPLVRQAQEATQQNVTAGMFHGLSVSEAAQKYLDLKKTKQRMKDIVAGIQQGGIESTADNFYSNVFTTLARRKEFIRIGKYWALAQWYPTRPGGAAEKKPAPRKSKAQRKKATTKKAASDSPKAQTEPEKKTEPKE